MILEYADSEDFISRVTEIKGIMCQIEAYRILLILVVCLSNVTSAAAGLEVCEVLHRSYKVVGLNHSSDAAWHPPSVQLEDGTVCHFGHEHGSDPARFVAADTARPVTFGSVDRLAGREEPHTGFKVFVVEDDGHGLAYRIVVHQGTGHGRRALIQHHEVQFAVADARTGELLADTAILADFGHGQQNCLPHTPLQPVPSTSHQHGPTPNRSVPTTECAAETPYETWRMAYTLTATPGSTPVFSSRLTFEVDDPQTVVDPADPERLVYLCWVRVSRTCDDPSGAQTAWKGTRRGLVAPMLVLDNPNGPEQFTTDAYGNPGDLVPQFVSSKLRLDFSAECCGPTVVFKERDGVYVRQAGGGPTFSAPTDDTTVRWPN
jgi:hypothetical protein